MSFVCFLPHKVEGHSIEVIDHFMFIFGGFNSLGVTDSIIKVDLDNMESHVIKATLKYKRENHTSQLINGDTIVIAGGWNGNQSMDSIEIFQFNKAS